VSIVAETLQDDSHDHLTPENLKICFEDVEDVTKVVGLLDDDFQLCPEDWGHLREGASRKPPATGTPKVKSMTPNAIRIRNKTKLAKDRLL
jgi:hypothetical protein